MPAFFGGSRWGHLGGLGGSLGQAGGFLVRVGERDWTRCTSISGFTSGLCRVHIGSTNGLCRVYIRCVSGLYKVHIGLR